MNTLNLLSKKSQAVHRIIHFNPIQRVHTG